jgi:DNA uptake protein ComE-like DNA-binding protein
LGLQPWQVRSIYRYRSKGGVFREPSDFARLYGLTQKQYRELLPYIRISADYRPAAELVGPRGKSGFYASSAGKDEAPTVDGRSVAADRNEATAPARIGYPVKLKAGEHVDLNLADTTALKQVPGIGSYYARRIASYGKQLGGYVSAEQLLEIEGFPEDALPYFQVSTGNIHKLNVNTLSLSKLRQHPYLNFYQARAICDYRRLKGPLHSLDDLKMLPEFPADVIARLRPYVSFE